MTITLLNIDTYSNILIESSINTNEMYSRVNEKRIYVIDIIFGVNESILSGNEQQKVYYFFVWTPDSSEDVIEVLSPGEGSDGSLGTAAVSSDDHHTGSD